MLHGVSGKHKPLSGHQWAQPIRTGCSLGNRGILPFVLWLHPGGVWDTGGLLLLSDLFFLGHKEGKQRALSELRVFQKQQWRSQSRCRGVSGKLELDNALHREATNQTLERNRDCGEDSPGTCTAERQIELDLKGNKTKEATDPSRPSHSRLDLTMWKRLPLVR